MRLNKKITLLVMCIAVFSACSNLEEDVAVQEGELRRMPFNQSVFLLNNAGANASVYEVDYDFQGLSGDAKISLVREFDGRSHMTVTPDGEWLTVVNNGGNKQNKANGYAYVHFYNVNTGAYKKFDLRRANKNGFVTEKPIGITQVDFDRKGRLFIAGRFVQVVPTTLDENDRLVADADNYHNFWETLDEVDGVELTTINYSSKDPEDFEENIEATDEDEDDLVNDYFGETEDFDIGSKLKFRGGDITFTQNSVETGGFEEEHLITFTRAYGGAAVKVVFGTAASNGRLKVVGEPLFKLEHKKVTGAALMGDNHVIVSTAKQTNFVIYSLDGEVIARPKILIQEGSEWVEFLTSAGDMAATQVFDLGGDGYGQINNRMIIDSNNSSNDYSQEWLKEGWNLADIKLYRPQAFNTDVFEEDNPDVNTQSRKNSANMDIADLRRKAYKFASLGSEGGYAVLKFRNPTTTSSFTKLQVVETSWGKKSSYENAQTALNSYHERANVYIWVSSEGEGQPMYVNDSWVDGNDALGRWVPVGEAYIAENVFDLSNAGIPSGTTIQWVRIEDSGSKTPDGFDINFVSTFDTECGSGISESNFTTSYNESSNEITVLWDFTADDLNISETGGIQIWVKNGRQYDENRDQIGTSIWDVATIDAGELVISAEDFNYSGDNCIQDISFSFHTVCSRSSDGWVRGNVFSFQNKLEIAGSYCQ